MKKRLVVVTAFPRLPDSPHGGVEAVSVNLVDALARHEEYDVHAVTIDRSLEANTSEQWHGATIHRLSAAYKSLLHFAIGNGRRLIGDFVEGLKPDIVHSHDTYGMMVQNCRCPKVFTVHGFIHEDTRYAGGISAWIRSFLWKWHEVRGWKNQPHIISIAPHVRKRLSRMVRSTIHDIDNPVSRDLFFVKREPDEATVFSAGFIGSRKNTIGLVKAFDLVYRANPTSRLRLAGGINDPKYADALQGVIRDRGLDDVVTFTGTINSEQICRELMKATVFALVSFEEGAPMVISEAMAVGIPVVTSNRSGMPFMVSDKETGYLVEPDNTNMIAEHLARIISDPQLQDRLGRRSREIAMERFHPDKVAAKTIAVYEQVMAEAAAPRILQR